jgi:hypothetical protein
MVIRRASAAERRSPTVYTWLTATWFALFIPFVIAGISGGPEAPWGHAVFHLGYIAFAIAAVVFLRHLRSASASRPVRAVALGLACAQLLLIVGQIGELIVVATHTGMHAGEDALLDPAHEMVALALTAPGLLLSLVGIIPLTIVAVASGRRSARNLSA